MSKSLAITDEEVINKIYLVRGKKVMLDRDLSEMYGVETRVLNQAIKRNEKRFPVDFMFQMSADELAEWKSQNVISNKENMGLRKLPNVFTEQGVAMLSSVLNSEVAIEVNIQIIRIFSRTRELMLTHKDVLLKLANVEKQILKIDRRTELNEKDITDIFDALNQLITKEEIPATPRKKIGFNTAKPKK